MPPLQTYHRTEVDPPRGGSAIVSLETAPQLTVPHIPGLRTAGLGHASIVAPASSQAVLGNGVSQGASQASHLQSREGPSATGHTLLL